MKEGPTFVSEWLLGRLKGRSDALGKNKEQRPKRAKPRHERDHGNMAGGQQRLARRPKSWADRLIDPKTQRPPKNLNCSALITF